MLLYTREPYKVIKASGIGVNQHHPLNWHVKNGDFIYLDDLSWSSKHFDRTISNWINDLDKDKKITFINTLFDILDKEDFKAEYITQRKYITMYNTIRKGLKNVDSETKEKVMYVFKKLVYYAKLNLLNSDEDK